MGPLYFSATFYCLAAIILVSRYNSEISSNFFWGTTWWASQCIALAVATYLAPDISLLLIGVSALLFGITTQLCIPTLTSFGAGYLRCKFCLPLSLLATLNSVMPGGDLAPFPVFLYYAAQLLFLLLTTLYIFCGVIAELPKYSLNYDRLKSSLQTRAVDAGKIARKVSVHVPCYSEPPDLVIATLDAISQLEYEDFEVLVIDNNTKNPALWQPVEAHCADLGTRFRFFHVDPLSGAKSGALNFALRHTAADAEIIAVIDADYLVAPGFLARFAPLFDDELTAFAQAPNDYYGWAAAPFLRAAYYHYLPHHKLRQPALNEYNSAYLVGTVCMIRRHVLEKVGGWAEWALTEDLEMSMRILSAGYRGHVFSETWGQGLIPATMEGIKKQQFRWWAGATQELKIQWRQYLTTRSGSRLTLPQRGLRLYAILEHSLITGRFLMEILLAALCIYLIQENLTISIPIGILFIAFALKVERTIKVLIETKVTGGQTPYDYSLALLMKGAFRWTAIQAFVLPLLGVKLAWIRTNKFKPSHLLLKSIYSARTEALIGLIYLGIATTLLTQGNFRHFDIVAAGGIILLAGSLSFLSTLMMAIINYRFFDSTP